MMGRIDDMIVATVTHPNCKKSVIWSLTASPRALSPLHGTLQLSVISQSHLLSLWILSHLFWKGKQLEFNLLSEGRGPDRSAS